MKKSIILAGALACGIYFSSCQGGDNGDQAKKDQAAIDSMVTAWNKNLSDSLNNVCMMDATAKGLAMGDSMVQAASKKGGKPKPKPTTTTTTTDTKTDTKGQTNVTGTKEGQNQVVGTKSQGTTGDSKIIGTKKPK